MGRFSTAAQYFLEPTGKLDDQSGKFEVGYTKASKKFLEELQETYILPVWDLIKSGQDPILKMLGSADCTDEQLFKTMAMFWQFERSVGALHGTWLLGYTFGSKGEYQEVEYLEIRTAPKRKRLLHLMQDNGRPHAHRDLRRVARVRCARTHPTIAGYRRAMGLIGTPIPPFSSSGPRTKKNSYARSLARSSRLRISMM